MIARFYIENMLYSNRINSDSSLSTNYQIIIISSLIYSDGDDVADIRIKLI